MKYRKTWTQVLNEVLLSEALKPLDKSVVDAFYYKKEKAGKLVSTDGDSLWKNGMGGQEMAIWNGRKIKITGATDSKSTESILKYMKKSIPSGILEAVLADRDYHYDGNVVKISKKNFKQVHKDFKNSTKGKEMMMINDPKTGGSISVPVQFEEVEVTEGWKIGKYTIKDDKGKILGTYSSGGKAQKAMDDLMQKGDYNKLTVAVVEEVEVTEANREALKRALAVSKWKKAGGKVDKQPENIGMWWGKLSPEDRKRAENIAQYKKEKKLQGEETELDEKAFDSHQKKIAIDTVKNPNKSLLGGPSPEEAEKTLKTKFKYTDKMIAKLKEEVELEEGTVLDVNDVDKWMPEIKKGIDAPWVSIQKSTLGGDENVAIMIKLSLDPEKDWSNNILHNSRFAMIRLGANGEMEMFASERKLKNMRKAKFKSAKDVVQKINIWIKKVDEEVQHEEFVVEGDMLQAKMALGDANIKHKEHQGKIIINKKDKKKASDALLKSFAKSGTPPELTIASGSFQEAQTQENHMDLDETIKQVVMGEAKVDLKKLKKEYDKNEDNNYHTENYLLLAKAFGTPAEVKKVQEIMKRNEKQGHTSKTDGDWMYKNINPYYSKIRSEEVEVKEPSDAYDESVQRYADHLVDEAQKLDMKIDEKIDADKANDLKMYIENDMALYKQQQVPIIKNVQRKIKSGKYDPAKAIKLWLYLVDAGAKKYVKKFGGDVNTDFPKDLRLSVAKEFSIEHKAEIDDNDGDMLNMGEDVQEKLEKESAGSFITAAAKAKKEGKKTFVMGGKEYPVTIKTKIPETNKNDKSDDGDGLDAVQPKAVKKKFKDRKDKDIDNDGDTDDSDKFLHKKRKAISKAISKKDESKLYSFVKNMMSKRG